jgi:hypothetical protein
MNDTGASQQIIHDSRVPVMDFGRVFPHDHRFEDNAVSQGLLWKESFVAGLSPIAFFVHAVFGHLCRFQW